MHEVITNNLDLWTSALLVKSSAGRGSNSKQEAYGIKKLRELILDLAVRGQLVPQDPNDEPASELLARIAADKALMVNEGLAKRGKDFPAIAENEIPYNVPRGWEWARINDVGHDWGQKTPDAEFTYIDVSAIDNNLGVVNEPSVLAASDAPLRARKIVKKGTVIYSTVRPYLKNICVIEHDYSPAPIVSTAFAVIHPFQSMPAEFFALYFRSPEFVKYVEAVQAGIAYPAINDKQFYRGVFPIPPLAEQHRIVAKVDELMDLCEKLETQQNHSIEAHQALVETLLGTLARASSQLELSEAWALIVNHFDTLFTTEQSIDQLKQTIVQLAVMGQLVPQDPSDEPASMLLGRITAEKKRLVEQGEIRKQDAFEAVGEDEKPFPIKRGWSYVRLIDICKIITKGSSPKWQGISYTDNPDDALFVTSENVGSYVLIFDNKKYVETRFNEIAPRSILKKGDFLMNIVGASIGRTAIFDIDAIANINQAVCLIRGFSDFLESKFLLHFFNSAICVSYMFDKQVDNARANLSMGNIAKFAIPLPPLAEQHRIVAKVDELMALCDALKARMKDAKTAKTQLADAVVEQAIA